MIVRPADDGGLLLITQPAHASLARTVMESCVPLAEHPRRAAILHAIGAHDNGWAAEDAAPEFDPAGRAVADYVFLRLADLISLCFCTGSPDEQRIGHWSVQLAGASVLVSPDPFAGRAITMEISAVKIQLEGVRSSADLREALARGEQVILRGTAQARELD